MEPNHISNGNSIQNKDNGDPEVSKPAAPSHPEGKSAAEQQRVDSPGYFPTNAAVLYKGAFKWALARARERGVRDAESFAQDCVLKSFALQIKTNKEFRAILRRRLVWDAASDYRTSCKHLRRQTTYPESCTGTGLLQDTVLGPTERKDLEEHVAQAVRELDPIDQRILRLHHWDRMGHAAIGAELGLSEIAVRSRVHRAYTELRLRLAEFRLGADCL